MANPELGEKALSTMNLDPLGLPSRVTSAVTMLVVAHFSLMVSPANKKTKTMISVRHHEAMLTQRETERSPNVPLLFEYLASNNPETAPLSDFFPSTLKFCGRKGRD